jgi:hypothetical protein
MSTNPSELNNVGVECLLQGDPVLAFKAFQTSIHRYRDNARLPMDGLPSPQSTPAKAYVSSMFSLKESPFLPPAMPQDKPLQGQIFYLSPIKIGLTEDPRSCIFSEDFDIDLRSVLLLLSSI